MWSYSTIIKGNIIFDIDWCSIQNVSTSEIDRLLISVSEITVSMINR